MVVVALLAGGSFYFVQQLKPAAVVVEARRSVAVRSVPGTVRVRAEMEMLVRGEMPGRVRESRLELGGKVAEGEVLVALDTTDLELSIEKLQIDIEANNLALENGTSRNFDRISLNERLADVRRRHELGNASKLDVELVERSMEELEQAIERELNGLKVGAARLAHELKVLERRREQMSIRSPIDGVVTEIYVYRGDLVGGSQEVAKVISSERVVEVQVSEENFSGVAEGQLARVKFLGYGDATFSGVVSKTLPVADADTQRYTAHLKVDLEREKLFPGLTGEATITLDERANAIVVPSAALIGDKVFLVTAGQVSVRQVERGYGSLTSVEIKSGLEVGDAIIVQEQELFKEGDQVRTVVKMF